MTNTAWIQGFQCRMQSSLIDYRDAHNPYYELGVINPLYKSFNDGWSWAEMSKSAPWNKE